MESLLDLYNKHKKGDWPDKNSTHSYIPVYEELLRPYRSEARNILEIGLMSGESLRMWSDYFSGKVWGIDCDEKPIGGVADLFGIMSDGRYNVCIGDASKPEHIKAYFNGIKFDVIIEDANHDMQQQLDIFSTLKDYLNKGGIYIIEDIQDIDGTRHIFEKIGMGGSGTEIIDLRHKKGRYDDVLVIIRR